MLCLLVVLYNFNQIEGSPILPFWLTLKTTLFHLFIINASFEIVLLAKFE
jgi:hypothetical protein